MAIYEHLSDFGGLPVHAFTPEAELPQDPSAVAWRLEVDDFDAPAEEFVALTEAFLARVPTEAVRALVIGDWGSAYDDAPPIELLVALAPRLTGLRALFLGEMTMDQCEISWINQGDVTPLLAAWPALEVLYVRGAQGLRLEPVAHPALRELVFESGGLPAEVVHAVGASELPALTDLRLWLGVENYGGTSTVADLAGVLDGARLPALRRLALCNAEIADAVAAAITSAPVLARLELLDLSMGTLTDAGAEALLAGPSLTHLRRLDLHHHFLSERAQEQIRAALPGVEVDLTGEQKAEEYDGRTYRYTAVAE